jgi:hypothetical protein
MHSGLLNSIVKCCYLVRRAVSAYISRCLETSPYIGQEGRDTQLSQADGVISTQCCTVARHTSYARLGSDCQRISVVIAYG